MSTILRPFIHALLLGESAARPAMAQVLEARGTVVRLSDKVHSVYAALSPAALALLARGDEDVPPVPIDKLVGAVILLTNYTVEWNSACDKALLFVTGFRLVGALGCHTFGNPTDGLADAAVQARLASLRAPLPGAHWPGGAADVDHDDDDHRVDEASGKSVMNTQQAVWLMHDCLQILLGPAVGENAPDVVSPEPAGNSGTEFVVSCTQTAQLADLICALADGERGALDAGSTQESQAAPGEILRGPARPGSPAAVSESILWSDMEEDNSAPDAQRSALLGDDGDDDDSDGGGFCTQPFHTAGAPVAILGVSRPGEKICLDSADEEGEEEKDDAVPPNGHAEAQQRRIDPCPHQAKLHDFVNSYFRRI